MAQFRSIYIINIIITIIFSLLYNQCWKHIFDTLTKINTRKVIYRCPEQSTLEFCAVEAIPEEGVERPPIGEHAEDPFHDLRLHATRSSNISSNSDSSESSGLIRTDKVIEVFIVLLHHAMSSIQVARRFNGVLSEIGDQSLFIEALSKTDNCLLESGYSNIISELW